MKVLNNYSGLGGNRLLWPPEVKVTAVEHNSEIAALYQEKFPDDEAIVGDGHEYLLRNYRKFDFIWGSTPCPSHSRARYWASKGGISEVVYPDWHLWQEILFLKHYFDKPFAIENVIPFYDPFIKPTIEIERHLFWTNFKVKPFNFGAKEQHINVTKSSDTIFGFNVADKKIKHRKDQLLINLVNPEVGLYILEQAMGVIRKEKLKPNCLF